jgi:hypothetical protein
MVIAVLFLVQPRDASSRGMRPAAGCADQTESTRYEDFTR